MHWSPLKKSLACSLATELIIIIVNVYLEWHAIYFNKIIDPKFQHVTNPVFENFRMHSIVSSVFIFALSALPLFFIFLALFVIYERRKARPA